MKKGKSRKAAARKNLLRNKKIHPYNNRRPTYDQSKYDGCEPEEPVA